MKRYYYDSCFLFSVRACHSLLLGVISKEIPECLSEINPNYMIFMAWEVVVCLSLRSTPREVTCCGLITTNGPRTDSCDSFPFTSTATAISAAIFLPLLVLQLLSLLMYLLYVITTISATSATVCYR